MRLHGLDFLTIRPFRSATVLRSKTNFVLLTKMCYTDVPLLLIQDCQLCIHFWTSPQFITSHLVKFLLMIL